MATTWRGRSASRSRPAYGAYSSFSTQSAPGKWGRFGAAKRSSASSKFKKSGFAAAPAPAYKHVGHTFQGKINSFKTLFRQTFGPAKFGRPTPSLLNSFGHWVDNGAIVQTCSAAQVARWARLKHKNFDTHRPTIAACKNVLSAKFGKSTIKAVARAKNGSFLVATAATAQGRPFFFPS